MTTIYAAYCQAQSQPQQSWTELALISLLDRTDPNRAGIVSRCSSMLAFATFKGTRGLLVSFIYKTKPYPPNRTKPTKPNQTYQTKPTKSNQTYQTKFPNQTYQAEPTKLNLQNQTYYTKPTKPHLPNQIKARYVTACPELGTAQLVIITLCNKDSGVWDISTDSTSLGLTDTQMNTRFAQLAQIFPQNGFF